MTQSTFQELLTSQEARNKCDVFWVKSGPNEGKFYLTQSGKLRTVGEREEKFITNAVWQGWLIAAAPDLARLVLEKDAEIARLKKFLSELEADCETDYPPSHGAIKYAIRQAMKETSDE